MIGPSMRKFFKLLIPSFRCPSIPYLIGSVINVGDWIKQRSSLQPFERTLISEGPPFLSLRKTFFGALDEDLFYNLNRQRYPGCAEASFPFALTLLSSPPVPRGGVSRVHALKEREIGWDFEHAGIGSLRAWNLNPGGIHDWKPLSVRL
jgi:hypothetical protein